MKTFHFATAFAVTATLTLGGCADTDGDAPQDMAEEQAALDTTEAPAEGQALLNPNDASRDELTALPGIDSATVALIMDERPFETMIPLHQRLSESMDSAALDDLYREMFIPIDLNEASEEEILLIPGVGNRMAHEFEEYRPYRAIEQFRREIGKYVDEDEVARLERYVRLP